MATHGVDQLDRKLPPDAATLAESFKGAGYRTGGYFANQVLKPRFGYGQGFDSWDDGNEELYYAEGQTVVARWISWASDSTRLRFALSGSRSIWMACWF